MTDLIPPIPAVETGASTRVTPAAETIRALARQHGVTYEPTTLDAFAADVSRLSDAEVVPNAVENLLQALTRTGTITHAKRFALHTAYLREQFKPDVDRVRQQARK